MRVVSTTAELPAGKLDETVFELYPAKGEEKVDVATRLGFGVTNLAETMDALRSIDTPIVNEPKATESGLRAVVRDPDGRAVELYRQ